VEQCFRQEYDMKHKLDSDAMFEPPPTVQHSPFVETKTAEEGLSFRCRVQNVSSI
jgi:hypothetical protein